MDSATVPARLCARGWASRMTCNLVVHSGAWPDMTRPIGTRPTVAAHMDRAGRRMPVGEGAVGSRYPCGSFCWRRISTAPRPQSRGSQGRFREDSCAAAPAAIGQRDFFARRANRIASNGNEGGLPSRGTSRLIAVPCMCGGLARKRDLWWIARRYDIAGAPALSVS